MKRCVIVGAGELTLSRIPVREEDYVIAADGGYAYCRDLGIAPDLILGDFDSLEEQLGEELAAIRRENPEKVVTLPVQKDETDMLAAMREGLSRGCREFHIYAGQGGRLEHTIANIQCLNFLKENGAAGYLIDVDSTVLVARDETVCFQKENAGYLSLFSLGERAQGVTIRGMKYLLEDAVVTNSFPIGISNEFIGEEASVTVRKGALVIILSRG